MSKKSWTNPKKGKKNKFTGSYAKGKNKGRYFVLTSQKDGDEIEFNSPKAAKDQGWRLE
jgi:hypothetical protein